MENLLPHRFCPRHGWQSLLSFSRCTDCRTTQPLSPVKRELLQMARTAGLILLGVVLSVALFSTAVHVADNVAGMISEMATEEPQSDQESLKGVPDPRGLFGPPEDRRTSGMR